MTALNYWLKMAPARYHHLAGEFAQRVPQQPDEHLPAYFKRMHATFESMLSEVAPELKWTARMDRELLNDLEVYCSGGEMTDRLRRSFHCVNVQEFIKSKLNEGARRFEGRLTGADELQVDCPNCPIGAIREQTT